MLNTELDNLITKIILENYDNDYDPYDKTDLDYFSEFPLNLFYENQEFLNKINTSNIELNFDRQMINRTVRYFKDTLEIDFVFDAIREGNLSELSIYYACSIANKICRLHKRN